MARPLKRFSVSTSLENQIEGDRKETVLLTSEETHHLKDVLRLREGSLCLLFDRRGNEFISRIERFLPDARSQVRLLKPFLRQTEKRLRLTVAQAIPQDRKMDGIVKKAAELGIFGLIPLVTERTIVRIRLDRFKQVRARWERIAEQTLKQSQIGIAPQISSLTSFDDLCTRISQYDQTFLLHPSETSKPMRALSPVRTDDQLITILLVIGPEGGFSPTEVEKAKISGMELLRMGTGILKTDTAFVAAASFFTLMYE